MLTDRRPILLANARVIDPSRDFDGPGDVLIADGVIRDAKRGIGAAQPLAHVARDFHAEALDPGRQQRGGRDHAHLRAQRVEQDDVRARDARV